VTNQLRSELVKLRTTRTSLGLVLVEVALVLLAVLVEGLASSPAHLVRPDTQRDYFGSGSFSGLVAAFFGLLAVTSEFRFGTIRPTLVAEPRRHVVVAAKVVASALAGLGLGLLGAALSFGVGGIVFAARGIDWTLGDRHATYVVVGTLLSAALWAALGVGLGALVRHQVGAIVILIAWTAVLESIVFGFVPSVGRYLPGQASSALTDATQSHLLSIGAGGVVFAGWTLAIAAAAAVRTERTDVG
jgi:ABC-2 type transport system permease protein